MKVFKDYADFYDSLYEDKNYRQECNFVKHVFETYSGKKVKSILDTGCGTGSHARPFADMGYAVTGVDISESMLEIARKKTFDQKKPGKYGALKVGTEKMNIAILSYKYPIETAPVIKGIASYLGEKNNGCPLFIEQFHRKNDFSLKGATILLLYPQWLLKFKRLYKNLKQASKNIEKRPKVYKEGGGTSSKSKYRYGLLKNILPPKIRQTIYKYFNASRRKFEDRMALSFLKRQVHKFDCIYAIEIHSLDLLFKSGFSLDKVIYFSLESDQIISEYNREHVKKLLADCRFCVIQDQARGNDLKQKLDINLDFQYLPVCSRPVEIEDKKYAEHCKLPLRIVYSGYLCDWSCVREFLESFKQSNLFNKSHIVVQGHSIGTENYYAELVSKFSKYKNVKISPAYIDDSDFFRFLNTFDIGLAFYKGDKRYVNWNNMLFSSGKIASYLWAGLGVVTNIESDETRKPPFIFINDFSCKTLQSVLYEYTKKKSEYHSAAIDFAQKYYNLDYYMDTIFNLTKELI